MLWDLYNHPPKKGHKDAQKTISGHFFLVARLRDGKPTNFPNKKCFFYTPENERMSPKKGLVCTIGNTFFQAVIFRGHVSFPGSTASNGGNESRKNPLHLNSLAFFWGGSGWKMFKLKFHYSQAFFSLCFYKNGGRIQPYRSQHRTCTRIMYIPGI